ncbi:MAG: DEAD/DEAH box helicase [Candidatus Tectomicrobia bacterium]|nr:DEAD/DEAH box helicase [Candidatus Tectomicrobia bacterium]
MQLAFDSGILILHTGFSEVRPSLSYLTWDEELKRWYAQAYRYRPLVESMIKAGIKFENLVPSYQTVKFESSLPLHTNPQQERLFEGWKRSGRHGVILLPQGISKFQIVQMAIETIQRSTLLVTPSDLVNYWYDSLSAMFDIEVGLIEGRYYDPREITVTAYDSAYAYMDRIGNRWGLIIFDECHSLFDELYAHAAECAIAPYRLGLISTLEGVEGQLSLLDDLVGPLVQESEESEAVEEESPEYTLHRIRVDLTSEERAQYRRYQSEVLAFLRDRGLAKGLSGWKQFLEISSRSKEGRKAMLAHQQARRLSFGRTAKLRVLDTLIKKHARDRIIIFSSDSETVYTISQEFLIPAITGFTDVKEQREILDGFQNNRYPALVTSKILDEDDIGSSDVNILIVLSGPGNTKEHIQRLERILKGREEREKLVYEIVHKKTPLEEAGGDNAYL